jgi:RimJ/RimL family protein N-acetyltransferase
VYGKPGLNGLIWCALFRVFTLLCLGVPVTLLLLQRGHERDGFCAGLATPWEPIIMHFCDSYQIESARFILRLPGEHDLPALFGIFSEPSVTRYLPYVTWSSMADADAWLARARKRLLEREAIQLVIAAQGSDEPLGSVVLFHFDEESAVAEIGYALGAGHWGKGVMCEAAGSMIDYAFGELNLRRLEAAVDPRNNASHQLLLKLGFVQEGMRRANRVIKGEVTDSNVYGLLKQEWRAAHQ